MAAIKHQAETPGPQSADGTLTRMAADPHDDPKYHLKRYLQICRDALLWKLEGLGEYDIRRPLTPTGTNLLGLVKHAASVEAGYLGDMFGRPFNEPLPWLDDGRRGQRRSLGDGRRVP